MTDNQFEWLVAIVLAAVCLLVLAALNDAEATVTSRDVERHVISPCMEVQAYRLIVDRRHDLNLGEAKRALRRMPGAEDSMAEFVAAAQIMAGNLPPGNEYDLYDFLLGMCVRKMLKVEF